MKLVQLKAFIYRSGSQSEIVNEAMIVLTVTTVNNEILGIRVMGIEVRVIRVAGIEPALTTWKVVILTVILYSFLTPLP